MRKVSPRGMSRVGTGGKDVYVDEHAGPADEVLQTLALIARRGHMIQSVLEDCPMGQKLRQLLSCAIEWVGRPLIYFARIVNLRSSFEQLVAELSRRLAGLFRPGMKRLF